MRIKPNRGGMLVPLAARETQKADYPSRYITAAAMMLAGTDSARQAGDLIRQVWHNAIYQLADPRTDSYTREDGPAGAFLEDFGQALNKLFTGQGFRSQLSRIEEDQALVSGLMEELDLPPDGEDGHQALYDLYDIYRSLTGLVTKPSGNLETFSNSLHSLCADFSGKYDTLRLS